jgi:chromate reductase
MAHPGDSGEHGREEHVTDIRVAGIAGSLRKQSLNRALLRAAVALAPPGMTIETLDIAAVPLYNADVEAEGIPAPVTALAERVRDADAVLIVTPEYNRSVPGVMKNTIDWLSRVPGSIFNGKPAAMMSASPGMFGGERAQNHLRQISLFFNLLLMTKPEVYVMRAHEKFDAHGELTDAKTREKVAELLVALRDWTALLGGKSA